ncbi:MAG: hypothetical protein ACLGGV_05550 [Bacteroidia bacterium]
MNEQKKSKEPLFITIIVILGLITLIMGYDWYVKGKSLDTCTQSNNELAAELNELNGIMMGSDVELMTDDIKENLKNMLAEYSEMKTDNVALNDSISKEKQKIEALLAELQDNKQRSAYEIYKLNKENQTLRKIMQGYVHTIDSLNTMNIALKEEVQLKDQKLNQVTSERDQVVNKNQELEEKVSLGSQLKASTIVSTAFKLRDNGKQVETTRASRANMLKACFTVDENKIAKAGNKRIYLRVISPSANVLTNSSSIEFSFGDQKSMCSSYRDINYQNAAADICIYYEHTADEFEEGEYIVELYCEKALIGKSSFALK